MKAVICEKGNKPDSLVCREVEKPVPGDNKVPVRIHAAAVNAADIRSMKLGAISKLKIFGCDIAGGVEAVGKDVRRFKNGDEVLGDISQFSIGALPNMLPFPEAMLAVEPATIPFETAAEVPYLH